MQRERTSFEEIMKRTSSRSPEGPSPYDFRRTEKFTADQNRFLEEVFVAFSEAVVVALAPMLQTRFRIELAGIHSRSYQAYLNSLPEPTPILVFQLEEEARGFLDLEFELSFALFERLMGGRGNPPRDEVRPYFTDLEKAVLQKPLGRILEALRKAWDRIQKPLQPVALSLEFNPMAVHIASPSETMVLASFQVELAAAQGLMNLCLPFRYLKENLPKASFEERVLARESGSGGQQVTPLFAKNLEGARVPVAASLGRAELLFQELLSLEVGDTIRLDTEIHQPLRIKVNNRTKFLGHPGIKDGKLAAKVSRVLQEGDEEFDE